MTTARGYALSLPLVFFALSTASAGDAFDQRKADIIEFLYFGGMTVPETAEAIGVCEATVHHELKMAKAWLHAELAH